MFEVAQTSWALTIERFESLTCYGPNCDRIFDRIMPVEILGTFVG